MDDLTSLGDLPTPMSISNHSDVDFVSEFEGEIEGQINTLRNNNVAINNNDSHLDVSDNNIQDENKLIINYDSKGQ